MQRFGTLLQLGLVVPSLDEAIDGFLAKGVGPFFVMSAVPLHETRYRGAQTSVDMSVAIAYSGDTQIEIIASRGTGPSVYRDFLLERPVGGLHHLGFLTTRYDDALAGAHAAGTVLQEMTSANGSRFAYLERDAVSGAYIELIESDRMLLRLFDHIRATCAGWDGAEPRRTIGG